jgi:adenylate cyclase
MSIRVVLGEDNVLVREGVRALLDSYDDIEVVGVAADAPSLLAAAAEHVPDVVVTDIKMPPSFRLEGIDCAHQIRAEHPGTGVVVLSAHDDEEYALALLGAGHSGLAYLLKDRIAQGDELARAIREVGAGGSSVDPAIAERLSGRAEADQTDQQILDMMARGMGYEEIASALGTTQEAVDGRVTGVFRKMAAQAQGGSIAAVDEMKRLHAAVVEKDRAATNLRSFVPQQVADRLALGEDAAAQQELEVTVLFSDIRGFSTIAERLSARQIADIVGIHLSAMAEVVVAHGGTIDKFQGDAVMAIFGAPDPLPEHASAALGCAIAMQRRQGELNAAGWGAELAGRLEVGIGLNTGTVVAGAVGGGGRLEYTVIGDAVNIAQRLQSEAGGGEIVASASTIQAAPEILAEPIGPRIVKGREEPVEVYRIVIG